MQYEDIETIQSAEQNIDIDHTIWHENCMCH